MSTASAGKPVTAEQGRPNDDARNDDRVLPRGARLIRFPHHATATGELVPIELDDVIPFCTRRLFSVIAGAGSDRGHHAHRRCQQLLICTRGACDIRLHDGHGYTPVRLDRQYLGLYIPTLIWVEVSYLVNESTLLVLCSEPFDAQDYVHGFAEFLLLTRTGQR